MVGVKDSCGNLAQSLDLLRRRPSGFSVMTGEDASFYTLLAHGADGGILASAHLETEHFVAMHERMAANDHRAARAIWSGLDALVPLLFREANPMPIKHVLWRRGLIASPECRTTELGLSSCIEAPRARPGHNGWVPRHVVCESPIPVGR